MLGGGDDDVRAGLEVEGEGGMGKGKKRLRTKMGWLEDY